MSILDKFRKQVATPLQPQVGTPSGQEETFSFVSLPESLDQMKALPEAALAIPFQTAALAVCALCVSGADNPREIVLRQKGDGQWLLWEQYLMVSIRQSKSEDPWA